MSGLVGKIAYRPVGFLLGAAAGGLSGLVFKQVWKRVTGDVRFNGRVVEACAARHQRRAVRDLYHSALGVRLDGDRFVIERGNGAVDRSVVREGPVGLRRLGRVAAFRYEVRRCTRVSFLMSVRPLADLGRLVMMPAVCGGSWISCRGYRL